MKYGKIYVLVLGCFFYLWGCNSGEYDLNEYTINSVDKKIVVDTIKKVTNGNDTAKNTLKENFVFVVQIGAFFNKTNFDAFFEKAKKDIGGEVYYVSTNNLYKIRCGSFTMRAEAQKYLERVVALGYTDAYVITARKP